MEERAPSLADEKMPTLNNVEKKRKEKLHNVLVKFKKKPRVKRHWIKMQLIIFSRHDRQFTLNIMNYSYSW